MNLLIMIICRKLYKGLRGLKAHQRSCGPSTSLNNENIVENDYIEQETIENYFVATN